jgi:predicted XRE-type DNA-binding protein
LLIGGSKVGDDQFYERMIPIADHLYDEHLKELARENAPVTILRRSDMAKNFNELRRKMSPERQRRNTAEAERMLLEMTLQELRQGITNFSQEDIAEMLKVTQGYVSKLERQDDMLVSNLYAYVEALGGQVEIRAKFPNQEVQINQFREIDKLKAVLAPKTKKMA